MGDLYSDPPFYGGLRLRCGPSTGGHMDGLAFHVDLDRAVSGPVLSVGMGGAPRGRGALLFAAPVFFWGLRPTPGKQLRRGLSSRFQFRPPS
jgi:hypothetical protein